MVLLSFAVALMQRSCDRSASETVVHGKRGKPTHQDASPALRRRVGHRLGTATARARRSGLAAAAKPVWPLRSRDGRVAPTSTGHARQTHRSEERLSEQNLQSEPFGPRGRLAAGIWSSTTLQTVLAHVGNTIDV